MIMHPQLEKALEQRQAIKIISGLTNFDHSNVSAIAKAAQAGGPPLSTSRLPLV